jgi:hypothetical protein
LPAAIDFEPFVGYIIGIENKNMKNAQTDFIVTTSNGTMHAETGASMGEVRRKFWGKKIGLKIAKIETGKLFTDEEEAEMDREKAIWRIR